MSKNTSRKPKIAEAVESAPVAAPVAAAVPEIIEPAAADIEGGGDGKSKGRFFKLITAGGDAHGRFSGNKPKQAANKALTAIIKSMGSEDAKDKVIPFTIKECTRGSRTKLYSYTGHRVELETPMEVRIGKGDDEKVIKYKFTNQVKKAPRADIKDEAKVEAAQPQEAVAAAVPAPAAPKAKATRGGAKAAAAAPVAAAIVAPVVAAPVAAKPAKAPATKAPVAKTPAKAPVAKGGKAAPAPVKTAAK
jgi:hypothetical protein